MSTAFTPPANATWQTLLNELTLAYSERRQVLGQSAYIPEDRDVQTAAYWAGLQGWIETNCIGFVDCVYGPLDETRSDFLLFSLASFRASAGLHTDGFRRVPVGIEWDGETDPEWSYGFMEVGDIIGPWIFEDLQKAFSVLKWVHYPQEEYPSHPFGRVVRFGGQERYGQNYFPYDTSVETAYSSALADWFDSEWYTPWWRIPWALATCWIYHQGENTYRVDIRRVRWRYKLEATHPLSCGRIYEMYTKAATTTPMAYWGTLYPVFGRHGDYASGPALVENKYVLGYASPETIAAFVETGFLTGSEPPLLGDTFPPVGDTVCFGFVEGGGGPELLVKWSFTNA